MLVDIVRAWKDEEYFDSLTEDEKKLVPESPVGVVEIEEPELIKFKVFNLSDSQVPGLCPTLGITCICLTFGCGPGGGSGSRPCCTPLGDEN